MTRGRTRTSHWAILEFADCTATATSRPATTEHQHRRHPEPSRCLCVSDTQPHDWFANTNGRYSPTSRSAPSKSSPRRRSRTGRFLSGFASRPATPSGTVSPHELWKRTGLALAGKRGIAAKHGRESMRHEHTLTRLSPQVQRQEEALAQDPHWYLDDSLRWRSTAALIRPRPTITIYHHRLGDESAAKDRGRAWQLPRHGSHDQWLRRSRCYDGLELREYGLRWNA